VTLSLAPRQFAARGSLWPLARLLPVGIAGAAGGLAFHPLFGYQPLIKPVAIATLVPLILAGVPAAAHRRIPIAAYQVISVGLWLLSASVVLFAGTATFALSSAAFTAVGKGAVNGWAQLLNITLPAPPQPELLVVPFTLTWIAVAVGAEVIVRARVVLAPLLPPLVAFIIALAFSVPGSASDTPEAVVFTLAGLAAALLRGPRQVAVLLPDSTSAHLVETAGTGWRWGTYGGRGFRVGLCAVAVSLAITGLATVTGLDALSHRTAVDPRQYWSVPVKQVAQLNPLSQVAGWLAQPGQYLFQGEPGTAANWQIAVLDQFDGEQWTSAAQFTPAGLGVPWPSGAQPGQPVRTDLRVGGLSGVLIPTAGRPVGVENPGLSVDTNSGMLLSSSQLRPGMDFTVSSEPVPSLPAASLAALSAAAGSGTAQDLGLPENLPAGLYELAAAATDTGTPTSAFQKARLIERYLLRNFTNDPKTSAGAAVGDLQQFLTSQTGTTVQFAEAFTLAARILRLPSRLVVGFTRGSRAGTSQAYRVQGGDVLVWSEVDFARAGWIPFFPTPTPTPTPQSKHASGATVPAGAAGQAGAPPRASRVTPRSIPHASPARAPASSRRQLLLWIAWTLVAVGVLCHAALIFLAPRIRRHRRQARGTPEQRITGAWLDLLEQLAGLGTRPFPGDTNSAITNQATQASGQRGMHELTQLSTLVTTTLFDPAGSASEASAATAWRYRDATRAALRDAATVNRRLRVRAIAHGGTRLLRGNRR
jgi:hypothetical protein